MLVYRFKPAERADHRVALTLSATGDNLPADGAPWQAIGEFDLAASDPWIKAPRADIAAALKVRGVFLWGITLPGAPERFGRAPRG